MSYIFTFTALKNMLYVTILLFALAFIMNLLFKLIRVLVAKIPNGSKTINYLTAIGVAHHELSHALLYTLTGAKVTKIKLFQSMTDDGSLGYVTADLRGPEWLWGVQRIMSGLGPVIMGYTSIYLMLTYLRPWLQSLNLTLIWILFYYVLGSIVLHCTLSDTDMHNVLRGLKNPISILVVLAIIYVVVVVCVLTNFMILLPAFKLMAAIKSLIP